MPLSNIVVIDDKCKNMSGKLGDTNGNNLLDITEVWVYTCTIHLNQTTTNTVSITALANGLKAVGYATMAVTVAAPTFPNTGINPNFRIIVWGILSGALVALIMFFLLTRKHLFGKKK